MLILDGIEVRYPSGRTVGPLHAEGPDDRPWLVLGPTGAGKSTLLRVLGGILRPTRGRVRGFDPGREAAYLPQFPERALTGRHLAEDLTGEVRPTLESRRRLRHALAEVGLAGVSLGRSGKRLSAGERRRLTLAWLRLSGRRRWVLDEPDAGLDARGEGRLLEILGALGSDRFVVSTHRYELYADFRPWGLVLEGGRQVAAGDLQDLLRHPGVARSLELGERGAFRVWSELQRLHPRRFPGTLHEGRRKEPGMPNVKELLRDRAGLR